MKVLSLQWRITLMTVLLIGVTCVSMNLLLCSSGVYYMDSIADSLQDYDHIAVESGEAAGFDPQLIPPGEGLTIVVSGAQARFRTTNWYITAAIALLGGMVAYFVSGRALRPLRSFVAQVEKVLVPAKNQPDVEELSKEITKGMEIVYIKEMNEVIRDAFVPEK